MVNEKTIKQGAVNSEGDFNSGNQSEGADIVERARAEREGLVKENERLERNIKQLKEFEASNLLGSSAGGRMADSPQMSEEQIRVKAAKEFWKGTTIEKAIAKVYG